MSESERNDFLLHDLVVEEKVDGANLGISFDDNGSVLAQSRGSYLHLPSGGQWKKLVEWLDPKTDRLFEHLTDRYILFGEWCYAQHSVFYDHLPDWFLGFDVYDKEVGRFFSCARRDELFRACGIAQVPRLGHGRFTLAGLTKLLSQSQVGNEPAEGLYLRLDRADWLVQRAKLVRTAFVQSIQEHWSRAPLKANRLVMEMGG